MQPIAIAVLGALVAVSAFSIDTASAFLLGLKDWILAFFDWLFVLVASLT